MALGDGFGTPLAGHESKSPSCVSTSRFWASSLILKTFAGPLRLLH